MTAQFIQLYSPEAPRWDNISSLASSFEWTDMLSQSMAEYLDTHGVSPKFTREFVEAATRVNYGQDVDKIHALEGACSMAATGASSVQGGNFQIFEQFLLRSKAHLFLSTTVRPFSFSYNITSLMVLPHRCIASNETLTSQVILLGQYGPIVARRTTKLLSLQRQSTRPELVFRLPSRPEYLSSHMSICMSHYWQQPRLGRTLSTSRSPRPRRSRPWFSLHTREYETVGKNPSSTRFHITGTLRKA
jgi:hypothetical protein